MQCPKCHQNGSRVVDSRPADNGMAIRRRRECEHCKHRFTTFERIENSPLRVVKKNGTREAFDRHKLLNGIVRASEKRPITMDEIEKMVSQIEDKIRQLGGSEVSTNVIGEYVMDELINKDEVAYIRFASVYRQFKDMETFQRELKDLMEKKAQTHHKS